MIGSGVFQFGQAQAQVYVFLLEAFVYFSFLAHFAITSLVVFAEIALFTDLGLIDMFSANQNEEIVACSRKSYA